MITLRAEVEIPRPPAEVWVVLGDYRRDADWRAGVAGMSPTPAAPAESGQTTVERMRFGGRDYRNDGLVETVDPGRRLTWRTTSGVDAEGSRTVSAAGPDRCLVSLETTVRPHGTDRLFSPVLAPLLRRRMQADLRRLRAVVERTAADAGAAR